jgi:hypothetical protein
MNGMIVTVAMNVSIEPNAPRMPEQLVPKAQKQQDANEPFRASEEPGGAMQAEGGVQPKDQGTIADKWDQRLRLVLEPLLIPENRNMITMAARRIR